MTTISLVTLLFFQRQRDYILMAFYTNVIVLYTIGKLFLSSIQWCPHSHESSDSVIIIIIIILIILIIIIISLLIQQLLLYLLYIILYLYYS